MTADQQPTQDEKDIAEAIIAAGQAVINAGTQATDVYTALVPTDADPVVRLQFCTDSGVFVVIIDQALARRIGADLQQKGSRKKLAVIGGQ